MNFFFDRCMPYRLAHMAAALEINAHTLRHHDDDPRFNENTRDTEWLATLGKDDLPWIVFSGESQIARGKRCGATRVTPLPPKGTRNEQRKE